jgi:adenylate cyclase
VLHRYLPPSLVEKAARGSLDLDAPPERRVITVMFTDVVGFTPLTERLGPQVIGELLDGYLGTIADIAHAHGATVDKFIGDCVMIVFGAPERMEPEEQANRCVKLAREIHRAVRQLDGDHPLQARTGINTGEAVVGNFGSHARSDYTSLGPAVNVAARLESASSPDRILLGPETASLLGDGLPLESAGSLELKGVAGTVEAWLVVEG